MIRLLRLTFGPLRLIVAAFLLYAVASDTGARLARAQLASLPAFDYTSEVAYLRASGRYGEALLVADAGLEPESGLSPEARKVLQSQRTAAAAEQASFMRRAGDLGMGALSGRGDSLESLIGAVAADFFIVGDIRDLVIQGGRYVLDGETDEVILILSGVGLATTLAPEVDWVPSILKVARRTGSMTKGLAEYLVKTIKVGGPAGREALTAMMKDVRTLARHASPGGAARLLRHADSPEDVARLARFVGSNRAGAFALHITGKEGADLLRSAAKPGARAARATAEAAVITAARKGPAGVAWLRTGAYRALARPHWVAGIAKAFYKGNAEDLAARIAAAIDPRAWWIIPLLATWLFIELGLLARRFGPASRVARHAPAPA